MLTPKVSTVRTSSITRRMPQGMNQLVDAAMQRSRSQICSLVPEFAKMDRSQNNSFHKLTMEEHTFEYISVLSHDQKLSGKMTDEMVVAALLHDIGKPLTETIEDGKSQYLRHEDKAADEMVPTILTRLGVKDQDRIIALVKYHMRPVALITNHIKGEVTPKAIGNFVKDVVEKMKEKGIDIDTIFAFGRADLLSSFGPKCYEQMKVKEGDYNALIAAVDKAIEEIKQQIQIHYDGAQQKQDEKPKLITSGHLIKAGYKPGPVMGQLLAEAANLEKQGLTEEAIMANLKERFPV